jgi:DNA-binding NarL/FixJ family response regulator
MMLAAAEVFERLHSEQNLAELVSHGLFPWQWDTRRLDDLSPREREVFLLLGYGLSNRSISHVLGVTERTVKAHVGRILAKLMLESRLQAGLAAFALLIGVGAEEVARPQTLPYGDGFHRTCRFAGSRRLTVGK